MTRSDHQFEFLKDILLLINYAVGLGFKVTAEEFTRTKAQQRIYVASGRSKTMWSNHLRKLAGDLNFFFIINGKEVWINGLSGGEAVKILEPLGKYWESLHPLNRWGGNFDLDWTRKDPWVDVPHFERNL